MPSNKVLSLFLLLLVAGGVHLITSCSDVGFKSLPKVTCEGAERDQSTDCITKPGSIQLSFSFYVGDVDILFINDNSGSMFVEQRKMANAFPNFLDGIANLNFQIGMVTTDIASANNQTPRAANGNGAFQDGKLLEFKDEQSNNSGLFILNRDTSNLTSLFRGTIQRSESIACDESGFRTDQCPSSDERGIYAANLAVERGEKGFFRSGAHLALVVLSDEDERTNGGGLSEYPLEPKDLPETLVLNMKNYYPTKSFSVHSVITNDSACARQQEQYSSNSPWPTLGFIGTQYIALSRPSTSLRQLGNILDGVVGSICASDYGSQMGNIAQNIRNDTLNSPKQLACLPRSDTTSLVTTPTGYETQIQMDIDSQNRITFSNVPMGVRVSFSYECDRF